MGNGQELARRALWCVSVQLVLICCTAFSAAEAKTPPVVSGSGIMRYLSQYGYLPSINSENERIISEETMSKAIAEFQAFMGINITGNLDVETADLMSSPRCGVKDKSEPSTNKRFQRYAFMGSTWRNKELTYKITKYSRSLDRAVTDDAVAKAFAVWSAYTDLLFSPKSGRVHIEIRFERGYHGDGHSFDGHYGTLAHAFPPNNWGTTHVHFDDDESWTLGSSGINFFQVAVHEFGHALGLAHSQVPAAIMYANYHYRPNFRLHGDDIQGIQALYGPKTQTKVDRTPAVPPRRTNPECKSFQINFPLNWAEGSTQLVTGWPHEYVLHWKTTPYGMDAGYPKLKTTDNRNRIYSNFEWNNGRAILKICR